MDLVWDVEPISKAINRNTRQTYYLLEKGKLPAQKVGGLWCASRHGLRQHFKRAIAGEV